MLNSKEVKEYDDYNWSPTAAYTHTRPLQLYFYDMTPLHAQILFDIAYGHILIFMLYRDILLNKMVTTYIDS